MYIAQAEVYQLFQQNRIDGEEGGDQEDDHQQLYLHVQVTLFTLTFKAEKKNILVSGFGQIFCFKVGRSAEKCFFIQKFFLFFYFHERTA